MTLSLSYRGQHFNDAQIPQSRERSRAKCRGSASSQPAPESRNESVHTITLTTGRTTFMNHLANE